MGDEMLRNLGAESSAWIAAPRGGLPGRGPGGQDAETRLRKQRGRDLQGQRRASGRTEKSRPARGPRRVASQRQQSLDSLNRIPL